jgi:hypothetical protein
LPSSALRAIRARSRQKPPPLPDPTAWSASQLDDTRVSVAWSSLPSGVTGVVVYRDGVSKYTGASSPFTDTGLSIGTAYNYRLAYQAGALVGPASAAKAVTMADTTPDPPPQPLDSSWNAAQLDNSSVSVSWSTPPAGVTAVLVYRDGAVQFTGLTTPFADTGLTLGQGYTYRLAYRAGTLDGPASGPKGVTLTTIPTSTALAIPRGPVSGNAQAADFYDSVGVAHHPEYLYFNTGNSAGAFDDTAITRMQQLGVRHVRMGMFSPANYGAVAQYSGSGRIGVRIGTRNATRGANQPISVLWGTTEEVTYEAQRFGDSSLYTISPTGGNFLRPLDGPAGTVAAKRGFTDASVDPGHTYPTTRGLDDFHRSGSIGLSVGTNWTNDPFGEGTPGALVRFSDHGEGSWAADTGGQATMYWNPSTFGTTGRVDVRARVLRRGSSAGSWLRVGIIQTPGATTISGYLLEVDTSVATPVWNVYRLDSGARTLLASPAAPINRDDRICLDLRGGVLTVYRFSISTTLFTVLTTVNETTYTFASGARLLMGSCDTTSNLPWLRFYGGSTSLLENAGQYWNQGWLSAGGLQGANEPDQNRAYGTYFGNLRVQYDQLTKAKNARTTRDALAGAPYISSATGRITAGPAKANQIPSVASHYTSGSYTKIGNTSAICDVGCVHLYWGGHGPSHTEMNTDRSQWSAAYPSTMPMFCTETGMIQKPGGDDPVIGHQRYCPSEVTGEYMIRTLVINYAEYNIRRTFLYKLMDEFTTGAPGSTATMGMSDINFKQRASWFAIQNLLTHVGFVQGSTSTPITVTNNFTPGAAQTGQTWSVSDHLVQLVLQRGDHEYLIILSRHRELWSRDLQQYMTVPAGDVRNLTLTIPGHTIVSAEVAEPAKVSVQAAASGITVIDPDDGQVYPNPGDGLAYDPLPHTATTISVRVAGLVRVVRVVLDQQGQVANPPSNFNATSTVAGQINLTWTPPSPAPDSYLLERKLSTDTVWGNAVVPAGNATSATVTGLNGGDTWDLRLQAVVGGVGSTFVTDSVGVAGLSFTALSQTFDSDLTGFTSLGGASVYRVNGLLAIDTTTAYPTLESGAYNLTSTGVFVQAFQIPQLAGSYTALRLTSRFATGNYLQIETDDGNTLGLTYATGGTQNAVYIPYDPVAHAYWRIINSGGNILFQTAPDGSTWTTRRTLATPWTITAMAASLWSGFGSGTQPQPAQYDNFNTLTTATPAPSNVAFSAIGTPPTNLHATWTPSSNADGYIIYGDSLPYYTIVGGSTSTFSTQALGNGTVAYSLGAYRTGLSRSPRSASTTLTT